MLPSGAGPTKKDPFFILQPGVELLEKLVMLATLANRYAALPSSCNHQPDPAKQNKDATTNSPTHCQIFFWSYF